MSDRGLELPLRLRRASAAVAYIAISLPLGLLAAVWVLLVALAAALNVLHVGAPLLSAALSACRWIADRDRRAANRLLDAHIAPLPEPRDLRQLKRTLGFLALKLPVAVATWILVAIVAIATAGLLVLGVKGIAGIGEPTYVGPVRTGVVTGVALCLFAVPVGVLAIAALGATGGALRSLARALLVAPDPPAGGPVREMLAESLGDRTLSIAYWLPDREIFVDEAGRPVPLPETGSGRAWTAVEREGRRVAAIVHDADLDTGPELVHAAAAAASLALDNERLKADLRARVEELRVSRVRIVDAADAARRRIERDLHDGAQQHLVSLALDLGMLKSRLHTAEAGALVDEIADKLRLALAELRELARGIHPPVLTERGLAAAVEALAHRTPIPVDIRVELVGERVAPPVEAAAYFVVSEALTNVVRYAQAGGATVEIRRDARQVVVMVRDEGVGGADMGAGSGLRGLADRLAVLDGTLRVDSPPGSGTQVEARIPYAAGALEPDAPPSSVVEAPR